VSKPISDFTAGELAWTPWLAPADADALDEEQRAALRITPSNRAVGAYALVLAHDPETLSERSPLYNAVMFAHGGLPRADRELGAVATSRVNGCAYCASVHAQRFIALTKDREAMLRIRADGAEADLDPRRRAIAAFAAKLTTNPAALAGEDAQSLRAAGLSEQEILDLVHAVAMFAWANRLMQSLGEAGEAPVGYAKSG
jgi:uncharacterized peroxidase-related enzyme